jgi:Protein of unknown function (DUF664)
MIPYSTSSGATNGGPAELYLFAMSGTTSTSGSKYLDTLAPVENTSNAAITSGQVQMGNSTYPDSVGAQCYAEPEGSAAVLAYDVNGPGSSMPRPACRTMLPTPPGRSPAGWQCPGAGAGRGTAGGKRPFTGEAMGSLDPLHGPAGLAVTVGASSVTLGGLLKHMALVESVQFSYKLLGQSPGPPWETVDWDADPDWEWRTAAGDSPEQLMTLWQDAVTRSRTLVAGALADGGLDRLATGVANAQGESPSMRRILIDMIEEYARHVGHADLIRESVDGLTGEDPPR